eukprot:COSAG01_NODE_3832_length_5650_cov_80.957485_5_plen_58_part_00
MRPNAHGACLGTRASVAHRCIDVTAALMLSVNEWRPWAPRIAQRSMSPTNQIYSLAS